VLLLLLLLLLSREALHLTNPEQVLERLVDFDKPTQIVAHRTVNQL
jgi:hypothetical protein